MILDRILYFIFVQCYSLTGNYGYSLVLLSFIVTIIMLPLFVIAEKLQYKDRGKKIKMKPALDKIKDVENSREKYFYTREIYKKNNYHPVNSLTSLLGLAIQIPFFIAAFRMIGQFEAMSGASFGIIKDLMAPDRLLEFFGNKINLLPLIMTLVNLISGYYYRSMDSSNRKQLIFISGFFLVLLYNMPSALVLYWTMNNFFSIPKNIWLKKIFPPPAIGKEEESKIKKYYNERTLSYFIWIIFLSLFVFITYFFDNERVDPKNLLILSGGIGSFFSFLFFFMWVKRIIKKETGPGSLIFPAICWVLFFLIAYDKAANGIINSNYAVAPLWIFLYLIQILIAAYSAQFVFCKNSLRKEKRTEEETKKDKYIYFISILFLNLFFLIFSPVNSYSSDTSNLDITIGNFIYANIPVLLSGIISSIIIYFAFRKKLFLIIKISLLFVFMTIIYFYILPGVGGLLDNNFLMKEKELDTVPIYFYLFDIVIIISIFALISYLVIHFQNQLLILLLSILIGTGVEFLYKIATVDFGNIQSLEKGKLLPEESDIVHGFSKTDKNIVLFLADMFTGGYMEYIKNDRPDLIKALDGFIWYPNTLSVSTFTRTSMPSILGGKDYMPLEFNKDKRVNKEKIYEAYSELLIPMAEKGWSVSICNNHTSPFEGKNELITETYPYLYTPYWLNINKKKNLVSAEYNKTFLLTMFSIFHSAPFSLKKTIYSGGRWVFISGNQNSFNVGKDTLRDWAYLDLLPEISNTESLSPTFKYIHSYLPHVPCAIDKDGRILFEGYPDPDVESFIFGKASYYSAKEFINLLAEFVDWLKKNEIYNNTMIIVVSDHGNRVVSDDPFMPDGIENILGNKNNFNAAHALLLVKEFNNNSPFSEDNQLMSNADTAQLINEAAKIKNHDYSPERPLTYSELLESNSDFPGRKYSNFRTWEVKDSIFSSENWKKIE